MPEQLSLAARIAVETGETVLSVASYWEVIIKANKGILPINDPVTWWARAVELFKGKVLPIRASHVTALSALPDLHRDPFDRILIAQTVAEGWSLVTSDRQITEYPVRVIW